MTKKQASKFLDKIQEGWYFVTRYLDQEWSLYPYEDDRFSMTMNEMYEESKSEVLDREEAVQMLTKYDYSFDQFMNKLRNIDYYKDRKISFPNPEELDNMPIEERVAGFFPFWKWFYLNREELEGLITESKSKAEKMIAEELSKFHFNLTFLLKSIEDKFELTFSSNDIAELVPLVVELVGAAPKELDDKWVIKKRIP